jgi:hypothetical protein
VAAWEPDWATLTTDEWRDMQKPAPNQAVIGCVTYVSNVSAVGALPPGVGCQTLKEGGGLLSVPSPCDTEMAEQVVTLAHALFR